MHAAAPPPLPEPARSPRDELRWKLVALASHHGIALVSLRDQWDVCEVALRATTDGHDREIRAAVDALRYGIVADLVAWRVDGATRVERELSRRLADRAGIDAELSRWAIDAWAFAFRIPLSGSGDQPPAADAAADVGRRDVIIRARHLVLVGAFAGLAAAVSVVSGGTARVRGDVADSAVTTDRPARPPRTTPVTRQRSQSMATRSERPNRASPRPSESLGEVVTRIPPPMKPSQPKRSARPAAPGANDRPRSRRSVKVSAAPPKATPRARRTAPPRVPPAKVVSRQRQIAQASGPSAAEPSCTVKRQRLVRHGDVDYSAELQSQSPAARRVVVRFRVDEDGYPEPGSARVVESSNAALNASALDAVERLRYESAREAGCVGSATIERTIRFF